MFALTPQERMARPKTVKFIVDLNFLRFHTVWARSRHPRNRFIAAIEGYDSRNDTDTVLCALSYYCHSALMQDLTL